MKWIVVVLILLNLAAWLLGMRIDPDAPQSVSADQIKTINAAAMSVISPSDELANRKVNDALALEEETLAQLRVDQRGKVLMAPKVSKDAAGISGKSQPENKPIVDVAKSTVIVAQDRSKPEVPVATVQKPITLEKMAAPEPVPASDVSARVVLACYRLGPFTNQNSLAGVRRTLENQGVKYTVDENGAAKTIKAIRVYLGAYANTAALAAEVKRLKSMKIEHYVITSNSTPLVQLGYFSEPARAKKYQKTLKNRGIDAKAETIYHEARIDSWLDVQQVSEDTVKALDLPESVRTKVQACR